MKKTKHTKLLLNFLLVSFSVCKLPKLSLMTSKFFLKKWVRNSRLSFIDSSVKKAYEASLAENCSKEYGMTSKSVPIFLLKINK